ncbi:YdcF family protein [Curtobacterium albidum]|uniref:ElyC/SanA/YdcF family protein n=1 Tax=Curtobacterium citreum TaxID=2036 RepID=UPI0020273FE8|nr:ElyC/SanA/YdcF family protein [Curtobacterium albidum]MCL9664000.1 YdcF family protein [Curtobacterium albidum]
MQKGSVPRGTLPFCVAATGAATLVALAFGEAVHARAAHRARGELGVGRAGSAALGAARRSGGCSVIVLGFENRGTGPNVVNRWRAKIAHRTAQRLAAAGAAITIICCGGPVRGARPEADLLAEALRAEGWRGPVLFDRTSTSTWENITNARDLLGGPSSIAICSNGLHAAKAREYLRRQDAALAERLVPADDYRFGEMTLIKPIFAVVGLWKLHRARPVSREAAHRRRTARP